MLSHHGNIGAVASHFDRPIAKGRSGVRSASDSARGSMMTEPNPLLVGLDVGTTSVKAVVYEPDGRAIAIATTSVRTIVCLRLSMC